MAMEQFWAETTAGHHGVFGPASMTWKLHADPLLGPACLRSLLLSALHPAGMSAVHATAQDADHLWGRVARTLRYVGVMTYGSTVEAAMAAARARALWSQIDTHEPEVLLWMHCCQVVSFLEVVRRGGFELSAAEQNRYLAEQVRTAALWGLEPEHVPAGTRELARYFHRVRPRLAITTAARDFAGSVVAPPLPELMVLPDRYRPAWAPVAGLSYAALPTWARRIYGFRYLAGPAALGQAATTVALHSLRSTLFRRPSETV